MVFSVTLAGLAMWYVCYKVDKNPVVVKLRSHDKLHEHSTVQVFAKYFVANE